MKIYINKFGQITDEKSDYEAELQGSFYRYRSGYMYEIKNIIPYILLKYVFSEIEITDVLQHQK